MPTKKHLIPFRFTPASWGLSGKPYEEAEANYNLTGYELDMKIAEINFEGAELELKKLNIDLKYEKISKYDYDIAVAEATLKDQLLDERKLEINLENEKITQTEYEKQLATLRKEPWVCVVESTFDKTLKSSGFKLSLEWNKEFIEMLQSENYKGVTDEEIVEKWFDDINRGHQEEFLEEIWESGDFEELPNKLTQKLKNDGKTSYS